MKSTLRGGVLLLVHAQFLDSLDGPADPSWIAGIVHVLFDERAHDVHCKAGLRDTDRTALRWKCMSADE